MTAPLSVSADDPDRVFAMIRSVSTAAGVVQSGCALADTAQRDDVLLDLLAVAEMLADIGRNLPQQ